MTFSRKGCKVEKASWCVRGERVREREVRE